MPTEDHDGEARQRRLEEFSVKLESLSDLELATLSSMARHGTSELESEWDLILKEIATRNTARLKQKRKD